MKYSAMLWLRSIITPLTVVLAASCQSAAPQAAGNAAVTRAPVMLELFTSEGCSSCPPADGLLATLVEQQPVPGAEIIALEEHVDYWDQQGWIDPFSSAQWTQRQHDYAAGLADHGVYTPELVVNGRTGLVGSRQGEAYREIEQAAAQPRTDISVAIEKSEKRDHERVKVVAGKLAGERPGDTAELWLAITESGLHSAVNAGENAGHELRHAPVIRWLHKAGTANPNAESSVTGESDVKLDSAWKRKNLRVIAFLQEKRSRHILGAASAPFEP